MTRKARCDSCKVALNEGDTAYVQQRRVTTVRGTTVKTIDKDVLVCAPCATGKGRRER